MGKKKINKRWGGFCGGGTSGDKLPVLTRGILVTWYKLTL